MIRMPWKIAQSRPYFLIDGEIWLFSERRGEWFKSFEPSPAHSEYIEFFRSQADLALAELWEWLTAGESWSVHDDYAELLQKIDELTEIARRLKKKEDERRKNLAQI